MDSLRKETRIPSFPKIISRFRFWPKRAIAMEMGIETSPTNWQKSIWWNSSSRFMFFLFERLVLGESFYLIFLQVDEIWCFRYMDPVTWVWPPKSSSRMKWRETKLKRYRNWRQKRFWDSKWHWNRGLIRFCQRILKRQLPFWALLCRRLCESCVRVTGGLLCLANE